MIPVIAPTMASGTVEFFNAVLPKNSLSRSPLEIINDSLSLRPLLVFAFRGKKFNAISNGEGYLPKLFIFLRPP